MVLRVRDLTVTLPTAAGPLRAVEGVSFDLPAGHALGLVGETGAGKTTVLRALLALLPRGSTVMGSVRLRERELVGVPERELASLRGRHIGMIFQEPATALDPLRRVGGQIGEGCNGAKARERTLELLRLMEVADPQRVARGYPHQLSGGIRQRALIAAALASDPAVLLCDEPTSALDATTQERTLALLRSAAERAGAALVLVSHDLGVVRRLCGSVLVMYAGRVVERGPVASVFGDPRHPYTRALLRSLPALEGRPIPGEPPDRFRPPSGCRFRPRCTLAEPRCASLAHELVPAGPGRAAACIHAAAPLPQPARVRAPARDQAGPPLVSSSPPVLEVRGLGMEFRPGRRVLHGIDLHLDRGEILGLVGESGSGKTTLARCIVGLHPPSEGQILLGGRSPAAKDRRRIQLVFQDPATALNPRRRVGGVLAELLRVHGHRDVDERCVELLRSVGLDASVRGALPGALSGGQRQRVGLARALALRPDVIVADEPTSALDVSVQASVLDLLAELRRRLGVAILFISHDLAVVRRVCDRVAVLHRGRIVERAPVVEIFDSPSHPYTRQLLAAVQRS
jgi:peptide/nickel transport system ATP-binding protein